MGAPLPCRANGLGLGNHQLPLLLRNEDCRIRFRFFMTVFSRLLHILIGSPLCVKES